MQNNKLNEKPRTIIKEVKEVKEVKEGKEKKEEIKEKVCRLCHLSGLDRDGAPLKEYGNLTQHPYCGRMYARNLRALSKVIFKIRGDRSGLVDIEATKLMFQSAFERKEEHKKSRNKRKKEHKEMLARMANARDAKEAKRLNDKRIALQEFKGRMKEASKISKPNLLTLLKESTEAEDREGME